MDDLYARAILYFKDSAMIHVFAAQYYNIFKGNHRIEQMHLTEAEVRSVTVLICLRQGLSWCASEMRGRKYCIGRLLLSA